MTQGAGLSAELWERVADAFSEAIAMPSDERAIYLDRVLSGDGRARLEVDAMLASHVAERSLDIERRLGDATAGAAPHAPFAPGTRIGAYRIAALIGEGGMGEVYRAERVVGEFLQLVAIKVLRSDVRSAALIDRFYTERQILARLVHPHIVAILDGGSTEDGRPFLVMQYVDGMPITEWCDRNALSVADRLRLFIRVAETVQFAHAHLVVHRDLKPSNILVTSNGDPQLLDFGIAKLLSGDTPPDPAHITRSEVRLLTPEHAAPEQVRGDAVTTTTDVYGLGVLLYQLLTGARPHSVAGRSMRELERAILEDDPAAPSVIAADPSRRRRLRGDLDRIVQMALRKEPERRYASAGQLAEDVERHLQGLPVRAQRDTAGYRIRKFVQRNRALVLGAAAVLLVLLAFGVTATVQARRLARERDRLQREQAATQSVVRLLTDLLERGDPRKGPGGDTLRVADLVSASEERIDSLVSEPEIQARMWRVLGELNASRSRYARARDLIQRAYEQQIRREGSDSAEVARTYHELARVVLAHEGETAARPMMEQSVARLRRALGDSHDDVLKAMIDLADATSDLDARRSLLADVAGRRGGNTGVDSIDVASALNAQGAERFGRGHHLSAVTMFEGALRILDARLPRDHPNRLAVATNLSSVLAQIEDIQEAERLALEIVDIRQGAIAPDSAALAAAVANVALIRARRGALDSAEAGLTRSMAIERRVLSPSHSRHDNAVRNLATLVALRGRVDEAIALFDSAIAGMRARNASPGADVGYYTGVRSALHMRRRDTLSAARDLWTADSILRRTTSPGDGRLADLEFWHGLFALLRGHPDSALTRFQASRELLAGLVPANHPRIRGAECGVGIALAVAQQRAEAVRRLRPACDGYARWGIANPQLVTWGREAIASLAQARSWRPR